MAQPSPSAGGIEHSRGADTSECTRSNASLKIRRAGNRVRRRAQRSERGRAAEPLQPGFDHDDLVVESPDRIAEIESVGLLQQQLPLEPLAMLAHGLERLTIF